jgi:hypothetical protein
MSRLHYSWPCILSIAAHACIIVGLLSIGHRQTLDLRERKQEADEPFRLAREAEEVRHRQEERELQQEELSDAVLQELEALLQDSLVEDERELVRNGSEDFLAPYREEGAIRSIDPFVPQFFELSISNLQAYLANLYALNQLERLEAMLAKLARFDAVPETFQLGHSTFSYEEATRALAEQDGPESDKHGEGPDHGPGTPGLPSGLFRPSAAQVTASHGSAEGHSDGIGRTPFEDSYNRYARVNHDVYGLYSSFVSRRETNSPPDAASSGPDLRSLMVSAAPGASTAWITDRVFVEHGKQRPGASTDHTKRELVRPRFETLAHGVAEFQLTPLTIDGNLDDWGSRRHPFRMRWTFNGSPLKDGIQVCVRWSHAGFYYSYVVPARTTVQPNLKSSWEGDCFEVWIDMENLRRRTMHASPFSQQFCFMPFGFDGVKAHTFIEVGRGFRGLGQYENKLETQTDPVRARGMAVGRTDDQGYTVEGFISRTALAKSQLRAGMYIAMNISINMGYERSISQQWSLPKNMQTFDKPDTWGDVLLLGTDASVRFTNAKQPGTAAKPILVGQSIGIEVIDHDMNLQATRRDRAMASLKEKGGRSYMYAILEETGVDTGIFRGSIATQASFLPAKSNTLGIHAGRSLHILYKDRYTRYGEKDRTVTSELTMAAPVLSLEKMARVNQKESTL